MVRQYILNLIWIRQSKERDNYSGCWTVYQKYQERILVNKLTKNSKKYTIKV